MANLKYVFFILFIFISVLYLIIAITATIQLYFFENINTKTIVNNKTTLKNNDFDINFKNRTSIANIDYSTVFTNYTNFRQDISTDRSTTTYNHSIKTYKYSVCFLQLFIEQQICNIQCPNICFRNKCWGTRECLSINNSNNYFCVCKN